MKKSEARCRKIRRKRRKMKLDLRKTKKFRVKSGTTNVVEFPTKEKQGRRGYNEEMRRKMQED